MITPSYTEKLISALTVWRNPEGQEENWRHRQHECKEYPSYWIITQSEGGYLALSALAAIEDLSTLVLMGAAYTVSSCDERPLQYTVRWHKSCQKACGWALSNLWSNMTEANLRTSLENICLDEIENTGRIWMLEFNDPLDEKNK